MDRFVLKPVSFLEKIFHSTDPDRLDVLEAIISLPFSGSVCTCTDGDFGFPAGDPFVVYPDSPAAVLVSDELNCIRYHRLRDLGVTCLFAKYRIRNPDVY